MVVRRAQRVGCGIVFLATSEGAPAVDLALTEALVYGVAEDEQGFMASAALGGTGHAGRASALVMGPGRGRGGGQASRRGYPARGRAARLARRRCHHEPRGHGRLARKDFPTVITPHAWGTGLWSRGRRRYPPEARFLQATNSTVAACCSRGPIRSSSRAKRRRQLHGNVALATAGTGTCCPV